MGVTDVIVWPRARGPPWPLAIEIPVRFLRTTTPLASSVTEDCKTRKNAQNKIRPIGISEMNRATSPALLIDRGFPPVRLSAVPKFDHDDHEAAYVANNGVRPISFITFKREIQHPKTTHFPYHTTSEKRHIARNNTETLKHIAQHPKSDPPIRRFLRLRADVTVAVAWAATRSLRFYDRLRRRLYTRRLAWRFF